MENEKDYVTILVDKFKENTDMKKQIEKFINGTIKNKLEVIVWFIIFAFIVYVGIGLLVGLLFTLIEGNAHTPLYYGLIYPFGLTLTIILFVLVATIIIITLSRINRRNISDLADDRGVFTMQKSTFGSANFMKPDEAKETFNIYDINNSDLDDEFAGNTIYGQLTDECGEQVVAYKKPAANKRKNNTNNLIIGSSGSGKSTCFVNVEILQKIKNGECILVCDPNADLYKSTAEFAKSNGYDVKVLNLNMSDGFKFSHCWNFLDETISLTTGRVDHARLNMFVDVFMANTGDKDRSDIFWWNCTSNILKTAIGYISYRREHNLIDLFIALANRIDTKLADELKIRSENELLGFDEIEASIKKAALIKHFDTNEISKLIEDIKKDGSKYRYSISDVIDVVSNFNNYIADFADIPLWHPAKSSYIGYASAKEEIKTSALLNAQQTLKLLYIPDYKTLLSHNDMNLKTFRFKKSIYYICISDQSDDTKPISSLFFSFFFFNCSTIYDYYEKLCEQTGGKNPCLPVTVVCDELFSCGVFYNFPKVMSTIRKRNVQVDLIIQQYSMLEYLYGKDVKDVIQGNCSNLLFFNCNDLTTAKFISDFCGQATVLDEAHRESSSLVSTRNGDYTATANRRMLLNPDEVLNFADNKVLYKTQSKKPLVLYPFHWSNIPQYKNVKHCLLTDTVPNISEMINQDLFVKYTDKYDVISSQIDSIQPLGVDNCDYKDIDLNALFTNNNVQKSISKDVEEEINNIAAQEMTNMAIVNTPKEVEKPTENEADDGGGAIFNNTGVKNIIVGSLGVNGSSKGNFADKENIPVKKNNTAQSELDI